MNLLFYEMLRRKEYLTILLEKLESTREILPEGKLRVSKDRGIPRYYQITNTKDTHGKYISTKDIELAQQLAQKDYVQKLYQKVCAELADIEKYLARHEENELENIFQNMNVYRKELVNPFVIPDEMFVQEWERSAYNTNPYCLEQKVYPTKKDELVRSKSEVMLADMYYEMGIPYRYEAELILENGKKKYPDFTLLKKSTREILYHEHLGMLDDEGYRVANLVKFEEYQKSGIYLGKNLIVTYEAEGCFLNIKDVKRMVRELML